MEIGKRKKRMKKQIYLGMAIFALAVAVFFCVLTGRQFLSLMAGPNAVTDGVPLEQMEGQYITYSVAHPVASFVEEYYSGDEDRVRRMAYIIYDEERQTFFKLIVSEKHKGTFDTLMRAVNRSQELKDSWGDMQASEERPVEVAGSLRLVEGSEPILQIVDALMGEDSYSTAEMNELALSQIGWYVLEDQTVAGIPFLNLRICAIAIGISLLTFLIYLLLLAKKSGAAAMGSYSKDVVTQLLERQRAWLVPWCERAGTKQSGMAILFLAGAMAALTALGLFVGYSMENVMTCHLPMGSIIGELGAIVLLTGAKFSLNPDKLLKSCLKNLERALPARAEREQAARELLDTSREWAILETSKENIWYGLAGEHYWMILAGSGMAFVAEADRIGRITSDTISGQFRSGKVRVNYTYYIVQIYYKDSTKKKGPDVEINFDTEAAAGQFLLLARKRLGNRADEIIYKGWR